jgi:hypothetical protein
MHLWKKKEEFGLRSIQPYVNCQFIGVIDEGQPAWLSNSLLCQYHTQRHSCTYFCFAVVCKLPAVTVRGHRRCTRIMS